MSNCSSGCPNPGSHETFGECLRAKSARIGWANSTNGADLTKEKRFQADIQAYRSARRQGIRPDGSTREAVERAVRISNETGKPYISRR